MEKMSNEELVALYNQMKKPIVRKPCELFYPYTYDRVKQDLLDNGMILLTSEEEYAAYSCELSRKPISFRFAHDPVNVKRGKFRVDALLSAHSRGFSKEEKNFFNKKIFNPAQSIRQKAKPLNSCQKGSALAIEFMKFLTSSGLFVGEYVTLVENRFMDIAITTIAKHLIDCNTKWMTIQFKCTDTGYINDNGWSTNTTPNEMYNYIVGGSMLIFFPLDEDKIAKRFWILFPFPETVSALKAFIEEDDQRAKFGRFKPNPSTTRTSYHKYTVFMNQFQYDVMDPFSCIKFTLDWNRCISTNIMKMEKLEYWNHSNEQIPSIMHQLENSSFMAFRDMVNENGYDITWINHSHIDFELKNRNSGKIIGVQGKNLRDDGYMYIRQPGKLPYNINKVDVFVAFVSSSKDRQKKLLKETWNEIRIIASRNEHIDVIKHHFSFFQLKEHWVQLNMKTKGPQIIAEMERCASIPHVDQFFLDEHKRLALLHDEAFNNRREQKQLGEKRELETSEESDENNE